MQPAITVKNLSKTFRLPGERRGTLRERLMKFHQRNEVKARKTLDDINFEVMQGEGHGFRSPENKMREFHAMETFLNSVMGR